MAMISETSCTLRVESVRKVRHQECCRVRKVRPQRRAIKGLRAWITEQRKDQSPGTRSEIPVVQVDSSFEGMDGGIGSLVKWNPLANVNGNDIWNFLRAMNVPVNSLHSQGYISIGCEPCTRPVLPGQHEREGRWGWEDAKAKECGLHKGNIKREAENAQANGSAQNNGTAAVADIFNSDNVVIAAEIHTGDPHRRSTYLQAKQEPERVSGVAPPMVKLDLHSVRSEF